MTRIPNASALTAWRKSSYCNNGDGACVEISDGHPAAVPVRDSKNPHGPAILFPTHHWSTFITALKQDEPAYRRS
ncbi:DUF397 domain-containing protein [Streptomyces sp. NPDC059569]|uniref:DUF397 domain-containing protein n=1 Tax=Streptomyces sp. NPDC059569 TaxID=3346869 RepID=UPI00367AEDEF